MKKRILTKRNIGLFIFFFLILGFLTVKASAYDILDVPFVWDYLEVDNIFNSVLRMMGKWIADFFGTILNFCYDGFTALMNWNILELDFVQTIISNMSLILNQVLLIGFIVIVLIRIFSLENQLKTLLNVMVTVMFITIFSGVLNIMSNVRSDMISVIDDVVGVSDYRISDTLYAQNTVDILESMKAGSIVTLSPNEVAYYEQAVLLERSQLNQRVVGVNADGSYEVANLDSGIFGLGGEKYYRYRTDYWALNVTMMVSIIIYVFAIFKLTYLLWQWLSVNIFGRVSMVTGFWDMSKVGTIFGSALKTSLGICILYMSMLMFSFLCSDIMTSNSLDNWLIKSVVIFGIGMAIIVGSGFVNDVLGIDDGSRFALRSMFVARGLNRTIGNMAKPVKDGMESSFRSVKNHYFGNDSAVDGDYTIHPSPDGGNGGGGAYFENSNQLGDRQRELNGEGVRGRLPYDDGNIGNDESMKAVNQMNDSESSAGKKTTNQPMNDQSSNEKMKKRYEKWADDQNRNTKKQSYKSNPKYRNEQKLPQWYVDQQNGVEETYEKATDQEIAEWQEMLKNMETNSAPKDLNEKLDRSSDKVESMGERSNRIYDEWEKRQNENINVHNDVGSRINGMRGEESDE